MKKRKRIHLHGIRCFMVFDATRAFDGSLTEIPLEWPYENLSDMVEIGGRGCNGVNVAYDEFGLKPGGDIWPLTDVTSVWYVGSCSARKSDVSIISAEPGESLPGGLSNCDDESSCESSCGCTITESASCCSFGAITFVSLKWRWCYWIMKIQLFFSNAFSMNCEINQLKSSRISCILYPHPPTIFVCYLP